MDKPFFKFLFVLLPIHVVIVLLFDVVEPFGFILGAGFIAVFADAIYCYFTDQDILIGNVDFKANEDEVLSRFIALLFSIAALSICFYIIFTKHLVLF